MAWALCYGQNPFPICEKIYGYNNLYQEYKAYTAEQLGEGCNLLATIALYMEPWIRGSSACLHLT